MFVQSLLTRNNYARLKPPFLQEIDPILESHLEETVFGVAELCRILGISQPQLYRKVKAASGQSTVQYIRSYRLQRGLVLLKTTTLSVTQIAYQVGFSDPAYFSRMFAREFGVPPSEI